MITALFRLMGIRSFSAAEMGESAPPEWHGATQQPPKSPAKRSDGYRLVAFTPDGATAFATDWKPATGPDATPNTLEAPVRSGMQSAGERVPALLRGDLVELAKRNVSQATGARVKVVWAAKDAPSAAQAARMLAVSLRTTQACYAAFNAAGTQNTANAIVND